MLWAIKQYLRTNDSINKVMNTGKSLFETGKGLANNTAEQMRRSAETLGQVYNSGKSRARGITGQIKRPFEQVYNLRKNESINDAIDTGKLLFGAGRGLASDMVGQMRRSAETLGQVYDYRTKINRPAAFRRAMGYGDDVNLFNVPHKMTPTARIKAGLMNDRGEYSKPRMVGAAFGVYAGATSIGRIASGGGLYRDADGNFDIMGLPIV